MSFRQRWEDLWKPRSKWLLGIPYGAFVAVLVGVLLTGTGYVVIEESSNMAFCTSCHEMGAFIYPEYEQSVHFSNASGVRAECKDCHVPKPWPAKIMRKIQASYVELPNHFLGKIDTREKFEAHRYEMATIVWDAMRSNDSRECRTCHSREAMAAELQDRRARSKHTQEYYEESGKTCIDCHAGIAHVEPEPPLPAVPIAKTSD